MWSRNRLQLQNWRYELIYTQYPIVIPLVLLGKHLHVVILKVHGARCRSCIQSSLHCVDHKYSNRYLKKERREKKPTTKQNLSDTCFVK